MGLAPFQIIGEYQCRQTPDLPRLAGTPARPQGGSSCSRGLVLRIGANRPLKVSACSRFASMCRLCALFPARLARFAPICVILTNNLAGALFRSNVKTYDNTSL